LDWKGIRTDLFEILIADRMVGSFLDPAGVFQVPLFLILVPELLECFPANLASLNEHKTDSSEVVNSLIRGTMLKISITN
jgi:hypothetical protein